MVNILYGGSRINALSVRSNLNISYELSPTIIIEAFGNYNSAMKSIQGRRPQLLTNSLAARK